MSLLSEYFKEIASRKRIGLNPKPIDNGDLLTEIISTIKKKDSDYRVQSLNFFIYNTLPGTTGAAEVKARFLKEIILKTEKVAEISVDFAFEILSHMKGGPSIRVLLDLALEEKGAIAKKAADVLKTQVFFI